MIKQLRLSGSGGQGVITAAIILGEAAVKEGKTSCNRNLTDQKPVAVPPKPK